MSKVLKKTKFEESTVNASFVSKVSFRQGSNKKIRADPDK